MVYNCNRCDGFTTTQLVRLLSHIGRCHSYEPGFHVLCGIEECTRTYTNYNAFRNHVRKHHSNLLEEAIGIVDIPENRIELDVEEPAELIHEEEFDIEREQGKIRRNNAFCLMQIKEEGKLTQTNLDNVVNRATQVVLNSIDMVKKGVAERLDASGINFDDIPGLKELFEKENQISDPFKDIANFREQVKYYRENFNLVEPHSIVLGQYHVKVRRGSKLKLVMKNEEAYYVPLLESLQELLNNESVLEEIENPHTRNDGLLSDYCDAEAYRTHPLFSRNPKALQLILYFDNVEICNALGSKVIKHKLGAFYYTIANIKPQNRSHQNAIQLLALITSPLLKKYGPDAILDKFMLELHELEKDEGHEFTINGEKQIYQGTVIFFSADNLGAQFIGGYKEGAQAHRKCRDCMGSEEEIQNLFHEKYFEMRTKAGYEEQCRLVQNGEHFSYVYGINRRSPLNESTYYHVVGGLPGDCMHDVLEGVLQYEVKELLLQLIKVKRLFTLEELNRRSACFDFGYYNDTNKPSPIGENKLNSADHSLRLHAVQMWCFARYLPLLIGTLVPENDDHWLLFQKMLRIISIVFSPTISTNQVAYLQVLIDEHHREFKTLYPEKPIIPKMHYMVHMPSTILRLGPLVRSWCMRFEAKHSYFKKLANVIGNFTNVAQTLSYRHQHWMCYKLHTSSANLGTFMEKGVQVGPGKSVLAGDAEYFDLLNQEQPEIHRDTWLTESKWVEINGTKYKVGCFLEVGTHNEEPEYAEVKKILVQRDLTSIRFLTSTCITSCWNDHFQAYEVKKRPQQINFELVKHCQLSYFLPLHMVKPSGHHTMMKCIVPRYEIGK